MSAKGPLFKWLVDVSLVQTPQVGVVPKVLAPLFDLRQPIHYLPDGPKMHSNGENKPGHIRTPQAGVAQIVFSLRVETTI